MFSTEINNFLNYLSFEKRYSSHTQHFYHQDILQFVKHLTEDNESISINEINYVVIVFLIMPVGVLLFTGITFALPETKQLITCLLA